MEDLVYSDEWVEFFFENKVVCSDDVHEKAEQPNIRVEHFENVRSLPFRRAVCPPVKRADPLDPVDSLQSRERRRDTLLGLFRCRFFLKKIRLKRFESQPAGARQDLLFACVCVYVSGQRLRRNAETIAR